MRKFSILALLAISGCALKDYKTEAQCIAEGILNCAKEIEEIESIYKHIEIEIEEEKRE